MMLLSGSLRDVQFRQFDEYFLTFGTAFGTRSVCVSVPSTKMLLFTRVADFVLPTSPPLQLSCRGS